MSQPKRSLTERVSAAAEQELARGNSVHALAVLTAIGLLSRSQVWNWRSGRTASLEESITVHPETIARALGAFHEWGRRRGLETATADEFAATRRQEPLRFSSSGTPAIEQLFRTYYLTPGLSKPAQSRIEQKASKPRDLVVFSVTRDTTCTECQAELASRGLIYLEKQQPLCLACADLDHLLYLSRGDAALTRRARRHSALAAVVMRWSRARKRYERQGLLVEEAALEKAEEECLSDADARAARREREEVRRVVEDGELVVRMAAKIREMFPGCPDDEALAIAGHTAQRGSGRVGRSAAGRDLDEDALLLAVAAAVRHRHTDYDKRLMRGDDRGDARFAVHPAIEQVLDRWRRPTNGHA